MIKLNSTISFDFTLPYPSDCRADPYDYLNHGINRWPAEPKRVEILLERPFSWVVYSPRFLRRADISISIEKAILA